MKTKGKWTIGAAFAVITVATVSQTLNFSAPASDHSPCYTDKEVQLLMKGSHWSKEEAESILKMACQFSHK